MRTVKKESVYTIEITQDEIHLLASALSSAMDRYKDGHNNERYADIKKKLLNL